MARPKSWFARREYPLAKKTAKMRGQGLWQYTRPTRSGNETGYYVGDDIPVKLKSARLEQKAV